MRFFAVWAVFATLVATLLATTGCGSGKSPPPPPACDQICQDNNATRAVREMAKLAYNLTLQGKPVGAHDVTGPCPLGGKVRVAGTATSNALQGATDVDLVYTFDACHYLQKDTKAEQNYDVTLTGALHETGTIAVQPSSTTALSFSSDAMTVSGTVYDPPIDYHADACPVALGQDGGHIGGTLCGRDVGLLL